jgi:hypothetical protein
MTSAGNRPESIAFFARYAQALNDSVKRIPEILISLHETGQSFPVSTANPPLDNANPFPIHPLHTLPLRWLGTPSNHNSPSLGSDLTIPFHSLGERARMDVSQTGTDSAKCFSLSARRRARVSWRLVSIALWASAIVSRLPMIDSTTQVGQTHHSTSIPPSYASTSPNAPHPPPYPLEEDGPSSSYSSPDPSSLRAPRIPCLWSETDCSPPQRGIMSFV